MGFRFLGPGRSVFIKKRFYFDFSLMLSRKTFLPVIRRASFGRSSCFTPKENKPIYETFLSEIAHSSQTGGSICQKLVPHSNFFFAFGTKDLNSLEEISEIFVKNVISTWNYTSGGPQSCKFLSHLCVNSMYSFIVWSIFSFSSYLALNGTLKNMSIVYLE